MVLKRRAAAVHALLVAVAEGMEALLLGTLEHTRDRIDTLVEAFDGRPEGETDEVVAGGREQVAAVRGVDVEEDTGDDNALLLEELLEERLRNNQRRSHEYLG